MFVQLNGNNMYNAQIQSNYNIKQHHNFLQNNIIHYLLYTMTELEDQGCRSIFIQLMNSNWLNSMLIQRTHPNLTTDEISITTEQLVKNQPIILKVYL